MEFSNTLPSEDASPSEKKTPHIFTDTDNIHPFQPPSHVEMPSCPNIKWTPAKCARYDYILHAVSLSLGVPTLTAYLFDLAKSASYHVKLPVGLTVVDALSITFLVVSNGWSLVYFTTGFHPRMARGELARKWPTIIDGLLHCCLLAMADTTFSVRSGGDCDKNRAVGGCLQSRRALMIAAGVMLIFVSISVQLRFYVTCHAARERKRLEKAARREAAQREPDVTWSNTIR